MSFELAAQDSVGTSFVKFAEYLFGYIFDSVFIFELDLLGGMRGRQRVHLRQRVIMQAGRCLQPLTSISLLFFASSVGWVGC